MFIRLICITFISLGLNAVAQAYEGGGVHYSSLKIKVRSEAKHNEFRIPSNAREASYSFCKDLGFKKPLGEHFEKVNGEWQVQNVICTNQTEPGRSIQRAAKAYIVKQRMVQKLNVDKESKALSNYIIKEGLFKEGQIKTPSKKQRLTGLSWRSSGQR